MNHLKHYILLMRKAQNRDTVIGYSEKHHIFPKSIYGNNNTVVKLSAREHYIAHALLEKLCIKRYGESAPQTKKMIKAFFMMNIVKGNGQDRYINSRLFESSKIRYSKTIRGKNHHLYGKKRIFSESHLENMKKSRKSGENHPLYGIPRSEEVKKKISKPKCSSHSESMSKVRKGIKFTKEHKKNLSESHKGKEAANKGKTLSIEQKHKMSIAQKNKDYSFIDEEYKKKMSESIKRVWEERKKKKLENNQ